MEKRTFLNLMHSGFKCLIMVLKPIPLATLAPIFWYFIFYRNGIYFAESGEILGTWISMFGILYGLFAAVILSTVWSEYKTMGSAVKRFDVDTFIDLRDEEVSPLVHTLIIVLSIMILLAFMQIHYTVVESGIIFIWSTAYLLALIFYIILEIDDPCDGIWYIKDISQEWLNIDVKKFRQERFNALSRAEKKEEKMI